MPISPYGGQLIDRVAAKSDRAAAAHRAGSLPRIRLSEAALSDLYLLAVGAYSPLEGFMGQHDYEAVLERLSLANGLPWGVPVTLSITEEERAALRGSDLAALTDRNGAPVGTIQLREVFRWDVEREARRVYGTLDRAHPGVARLDTLGPHLVGGPVEYFGSEDVSGFPDAHLTPRQTRAEFERRGWRSVVAFQTRNPVHRAHEYLHKCALEIVDGLLLHPLVGDTKSDDVPAAVRMECYRVLLEKYYPADRVLLSVLPAAMRYAGPREAIFHAVIRRNYGCTHFIVGRDHAGVGSYYGTYDAQRIFDTVDLDALGIQPLKFEHSFFCLACGQMVSPRTCPHERASHVFLSGTAVRELLSRGERPPPEFSRPEVADVLVHAYASAGVAAPNGNGAAGVGDLLTSPS